MNKTPKAARITAAANTELLANLLLDIDAYAQALASIDEHRSYNLGYKHYERIIERISWLAESRLDTSLREVLADKQRIEDELRDLHDQPTQAWADAKAAADAKGPARMENPS